MNISILPTVNAFLNGTSACLLAAGYFFIKKERMKEHGIFMGLAFVTSTLFLISYLTYHYFHGATRFPGVGWVRGLYFGVLISHTILAVLIVPLVLRTLYLALRRRFSEHARLARWALPLWLYVSVTGVIVYLMLYRVDWVSACPMCKEALGASADPSLARAAEGFNRSILLLMVAPYLLFTGVTALIWRSGCRYRTRHQAPLRSAHLRLRRSSDAA